MICEATKKFSIDSSIFIGAVCDKGFDQVELFEWRQEHGIEPLLASFLICDKFIVGQVVEDNLLDLIRDAKLRLQTLINFDEIDLCSISILRFFSVFLEDLLLDFFEGFNGLHGD